METGKKYKLADKCITPGGRNMTRDEDAIIEAKKYYRNDIKCYDAFLHGVEWVEEQIANVWHDASEEPKENSVILVQWNIKGNSGYEFYYADSINWDRYVEIYGVSIWAYISDLLPKGGGK